MPSPVTNFLGMGQGATNFKDAYMAALFQDAPRPPTAVGMFAYAPAPQVALGYAGSPTGAAGYYGAPSVNGSYRGAPYVGFNTYGGSAPNPFAVAPDTRVKTPVAGDGNKDTKYNVGEGPGGGPPNGGSYKSGELVSGPDEVMKWAPQINQVSASVGVPADVIAAIMLQESSGDPKATGPATSDGSRARGLMQVMDFNWDGNSDPYDPVTNITKGAQMLKELHDKAVAKGITDDNQAWDIASRSYLGDWDWSTMSSPGYKDAYGTDGNTYASNFENNRKKFKVAVQNSPDTMGANQPVSGVVNYNQIAYSDTLPVTQEYGPSSLSGEPADHGYAHYHEGVDVGIPQGTELHTPWHGKVIAAVTSTPDKGYGNYVIVQRDDGIMMLLGHMSEVDVQEGQTVDGGTLLGYSGSTGYSTGAHVHIELRDANGNAVDPTKYVAFGS